MSVRASVKITNSNDEAVFLFHHWDGYPEYVGNILKDILDKEPSWSNIRRYASSLIKHMERINDEEVGEGFILTDWFSILDEYEYIVDFDKKTIKYIHFVMGGNSEWKEL